VIPYAITFARSAQRELEHLPALSVRRIVARIESLATHPRPAGARKMVGPGARYRLRVGDYRVIYRVDDSGHSVDIVAVRHRKDAYR
jgi:mRNA interferase RelE/StbE